MRFKECQIEKIKEQVSIQKKEDLTTREKEEKDLPERDDFQRDYARILYSSSFRRLQGKMQILGVESTAFFRNRLTHSLEVSQIACSIANEINKSLNNQVIYDNSDMYLLQAAALAHDIGHPAFGHKGERVLDTIAKESDLNLRFEGNAQNFRVLRLLEKKGPDFKGLNLTYRTLLAINKYIIDEGINSKKFMYREDFDFLEKIRNQNGLNNIRTLDVQIIDLADEIAYAVHDLEDALSLRYFNIDELLYKLNIDDEIYNIFNKEFVLEAREYAMKSKSYETIQEYSQVFRKKMTSLLTHKFIEDITLSEISEEDAKKHGTKKGDCELSLDKYKNLSEKLRTLIFECVTRDSDIALYERRGEIVLQSLYELYSDKSVNKNGMLFPPDYRPDDKDDDKIWARNTIDYLAGMMDTFAISEYEKYFGVKFDKIPINNK